VLNHKLFSEAFIDQHPYYRDFLRPLGLRYTAESRVHEDAESRSSSVFGVGRRLGREPFDASVIDTASAALTPHLARAARLHQKLAPARVRGRLTEQALDLLSHGVVVNGPDGRVVLANRAALALLEGRNGLMLRDGALCACDSALDPALRKLLRDARLGGSLPLPREEGPPLALTVAPLPSAADWPSLGGDPGTLVLICDRAAKAPLAIAGTLRSLFGLSAAEARVACFLARGLSAAETAEMLRVSEGTVRSQLKQVFAKMNVSRQSELAATVMDFDHLRPISNGAGELPAVVRPG
jgi:DNA-binding CsgD family transcriptional regulator